MLAHPSASTHNHQPQQRNGKEYAVKIFRKKRLSLMDVTGLLEEVSILANVTHPNIIGFVSFLEDSWFYYLVTELVRGGELFDRISKKVRACIPVSGHGSPQVWCGGTSIE